MTSRGSARHPAETKHNHILPESKEMTSRGLARHSSGTKQNYIQAESKERQAEYQPDIQQGQNPTTYWLRARNDQQRISHTFSMDKTQPHTR
jgi:hypothetical protein